MKKGDNAYKLDRPYSEDKWSFYGVLAHRVKGKPLPLTYVNGCGENVIVTEGQTEDGTNFFVLETAQHNGWVAITTYYEDGMVEETYKK